MQLQWSSAGITDVGKVRTVNEDACLDLPERGLWVVADGMGGHEAGDVASRMIVDELRELPRVERFSSYVDAVEDRLETVNGRLFDLANGGETPTTIGSTVVALLFQAPYAVCLWAGDSRLYRLRGGRLDQLTRDHSESEELVAQGHLLEEEAEGYADANVITRAVGATEELFLDASLIELSPGDRYLLCSDGLTKELSIEEIGARLGLDDPHSACRRLVNLALERGSRDNVTAVVIDVEEQPEA